MTGRLMVLACVILAGGAATRASSVGEQVPPRRPLATLPAVLGPWRSAGDVPLARETLDVLRADDYVNRTYVKRRGAADLFIGYYASQRQGDTMHSPMNCLPAAGWQPLSIGRAAITTPAGNVHANRYVIQQGLDERLVYYWYQSHGRTVASDYASKMYLVLDSLRMNRSDAAIVRVIAPAATAAADRDAVDFVRRLYPVLATYLPR